jgi:hypothetical protein
VNPYRSTLFLKLGDASLMMKEYVAADTVGRRLDSLVILSRALSQTSSSQLSGPDRRVVQLTALPFCMV